MKVRKSLEWYTALPRPIDAFRYIGACFLSLTLFNILSVAVFGEMFETRHEALLLAGALTGLSMALLLKAIGFTVLSASVASLGILAVTASRVLNSAPEMPGSELVLGIMAAGLAVSLPLFCREMERVMPRKN